MRVLIVDDHSLFRDGIVSLLTSAGIKVVGQVSDGGSAVTEALRLRPDLVLMDINMPGMNGLEALRQLRAQLPAAAVVMLTVSESDADVLEAVQSGARGYLLKSVGARAFLESLRGLERGEVAMTGQTTTRLVEALTRQSQQEAEARVPESLTEREIELLRWVAAGLSNKAIGQRLGMKENTVKYHMKAILRKLRCRSRTEAAAYAIRSGLIDSP